MDRICDDHFHWNAGRTSWVLKISSTGFVQGVAEKNAKSNTENVEVGDLAMTTMKPVNLLVSNVKNMVVTLMKKRKIGSIGEALMMMTKKNTNSDRPAIDMMTTTMMMINISQ
jgi:hypothetical protein